MLYELATLSVHNLLRARARLMMTSGGVMIGTTAVILLIALTIGLQSAAEASIGNDASLTQIMIRSGFRRDDFGLRNHCYLSSSSKTSHSSRIRA